MSEEERKKEEQKPKISKLAITCLICGLLSILAPAFAISLLFIPYIAYREPVSSGIWGDILFCFVHIPYLCCLVCMPLCVAALIVIKQREGKLKGKWQAYCGVSFSIAALVLVSIYIGPAPRADVEINKARIITTRAYLNIYHVAVNQFKADTGRFPTEKEGLMALIKQPHDFTNWETGGYLETMELPKDGWGNDFIYELNPRSNVPFVIKSYGADGKEGGEGNNADLYNIDL